MTGPWFLRRLAGDARRHGGVWLGVGLAFALAAFCLAGARVTTRAARVVAADAPEPAAVVIAYLKDELPAPAVGELRGLLAHLPGVTEARVISPGDALARLRGELGARAAIVDGVGPDLLFSSIEVTVRPASAGAALAFRLRRLAGVADVDLVAPPSPPTGASALLARLGLGARAVVIAGGALGLALILLLAGAFARLRGRYRSELRVLATLGLSRAAGARPALTLATAVGALGAGVGLLAAFFVARSFLGAATLPAREWGVGAVTLVVGAYVLSLGALRVRDAVEAT